MLNNLKNCLEILRICNNEFVLSASPQRGNTGRILHDNSTIVTQITPPMTTQNRASGVRIENTAGTLKNAN